MTKEEYFFNVGSEPENDDLERTNCPDAGYPGHQDCGFCHLHKKPVFMCNCKPIRVADTYITIPRY
jgi:hypothetical protein